MNEGILFDWTLIKGSNSQYIKYFLNETVIFVDRIIHDIFLGINWSDHFALLFCEWTLKTITIGKRVLSVMCKWISYWHGVFLPIRISDPYLKNRFSIESPINRAVQSVVFKSRESREQQRKIALNWIRLKRLSQVHRSDNAQRSDYISI